MKIDKLSLEELNLLLEDSPTVFIEKDEIVISLLKEVGGYDLLKRKSDEHRVRFKDIQPGKTRVVILELWLGVGGSGGNYYQFSYHFDGPSDECNGYVLCAVCDYEKNEHILNILRGNYSDGVRVQIVC